MSVAMDIMRALDPSGLQRFKINLDTPAEREKIGEVWTIKVVPYLETEAGRKEFNKLFDNNKTCKSWVVESKQEVIDVLKDIHQQSGKEFNEKELNIEDFPAAARYTILIHIRDIWE